MRWLKTLLTGLLCLLLLFIGILFTIHNTDKVAIDLIFIKLPQASLSLWLMASFVCGGIVGVVLSSLAILALKTRLRTARRRATQAYRELEQLRTAGSKDSA